MSTSSQSENVYFVDVENRIERERLARQGRLLQQGLNGHLPEQMPEQFHDVLDIACGDGAWVLDVARAYPRVAVHGVDLSNVAIAYAQERASAQDIQNVFFRTMDALKPFDIPDNAFDMVNARLVYGFIPPKAWSSFTQECLRILRPGGILRLTEGEVGLSNGSAAEKLASFSTRTMQLSGNSFSPDGRHTGITPMLWLFLRNADFLHIEKSAYAIEYLGERDAHGDMYQNLTALYTLLKPLIVRAGIVPEDDYTNLYTAFLEEMQSRDFSQIWYYLTVWGYKLGA